MSVLAENVPTSVTTVSLTPGWMNEIVPSGSGLGTLASALKTIRSVGLRKANRSIRDVPLHAWSRMGSPAIVSVLSTTDPSRNAG